MIEERYRFLQPYEQGLPDPEYYLWWYRSETAQAPGYGEPIQVFENDLLTGFDCDLLFLQDYCARTLRYFDEELMNWIEPSASALDLCVLDNWNRCHDVVITRPDSPGWIQGQACGSHADCSEMSKGLPVIEPHIETAVWLAIAVCLLFNAVMNRKKD